MRPRQTGSSTPPLPALADTCGASRMAADTADDFCPRLGHHEGTDEMFFPGAPEVHAQLAHFTLHCPGNL
eukprot:2126026-Pyramimonas_sp.AAC.1